MKIMIKHILKMVGIGIGAILVIALLSVVGGTIIYWIWPIAVPVAFPGLVTSGVIAAELSWWAAVCLTWIFGILIRSTNTNNCK